MKIHIDIRDNIEPKDALVYVEHVIFQGKISKNNTMYCYLTTWENGIHVLANQYRKLDCFVVYKLKI